MPEGSSVWAAAFAGLLLSLGLLRISRWLARRTTEPVSTYGFTGAAADLRWLDLFSLVFACGVTAALLPVMLPVVAVGGGALIWRARGGDILTMWNLSWREAPQDLWAGVDRYFLVVVPVFALAGVSVWVCQQLGLETPPQPMVDEFLSMADPARIIGVLVLAVVVAPVWEELFFRGILYPMFRHLRDRVFALLTTAVLFGWVHGHGPSFLALTFFGAVLAWTYERTGRIGVCIALHAVFNSVTAGMLLIIMYA